VEAWDEFHLERHESIGGKTRSSRSSAAGRRKGSGVEITDRWFYAYRLRDGKTIGWRPWPNRCEAVKAVGREEWGWRRKHGIGISYPTATERPLLSGPERGRMKGEASEWLGATCSATSHFRGHGRGGSRSTQRSVRRASLPRLSR
jgi:hypothetical protein